MIYQEISDEGFEEWRRRQLRPENGAWWPERWREIEDAVRDPVSPERWWGDRGLFKMETRAWLEWMRARGRRRYRDEPDRPSIPPRIRRAVIERDGPICGICWGDVEPDDIHIDHIYPIALGGPTEMSNLRVTHSTCNMRKGAKLGTDGVSNQDWDLVR